MSAGEPGRGGRIVYSDADNDGIFDDGEQSRSFLQFDPVDTLHTRKVTSGISVDDLPPKILDVEVTVTLSHPTAGDLSVWLVSPYGTRVELLRERAA